MSFLFVLSKVSREEEFAPVKNAPGTPVDSPDTARTILLQLHMSWVAEAGGFVVNKGVLPAAGKGSLCVCPTPVISGLLTGIVYTTFFCSSRSCWGQ